MHEVFQNWPYIGQLEYWIFNPCHNLGRRQNLAFKNIYINIDLVTLVINLKEAKSKFDTPRIL